MNNWYVITGGPSTGKTSLVEALQARGYAAVPESARHYIETERIRGKTVEEVRANQLEFQHQVTRLQVARERALDPAVPTFLDRGVPDQLAYYRYLGMPEDEVIRTAVAGAAYKKIFILDRLPVAYDGVRTEDTRAQAAIHETITAVYESLPFPIVHVPVLPLEQRVDFVLERL